MDQQPLREYLNRITGLILGDDDWQKLELILHHENHPKGGMILTEGRSCNNIWFLQEGAVRFFEHIGGEERTTHFFIAPSMFTDYHSLITGAASPLNIVATENASLLVLPYARLSELYKASHALERIGRMMAEFQFIHEFNLRRMLLHMDALERYEMLESSQPEVFHRFQLKDIATFLGITPVSLSRLRKYRMGQ